jgi:hypothetical protein
MLPTTPLPIFDHIMSFGMAGFMGFMWLYERRESAKRNSQIDEAHIKLMSERQQLEALMTLIRQNTEALARLDTFLRTSVKPRTNGGEA